MPDGIKAPQRNPDAWTRAEREADERYARIARRHGISNALRVVQEARREGVGPATAMALIEKETRGRNVFGHDPTIFAGAGQVTARKYLAYKEQRGPRGQGGMQGVGPAQLTYYTLQDAADREGGCWDPRVNIRIGLRHLRGLIAEHGLREGYRRFNGSGPAAEAYARDAIAKRAVWQDRFDLDRE